MCHHKLCLFLRTVVFFLHNLCWGVKCCVKMVVLCFVMFISGRLIHLEKGPGNVGSFLLIQRWAIHQGKHNEGTTEEVDHPKWKQNLRCALAKNRHIERVKAECVSTGPGACRVYRFIPNKQGNLSLPAPCMLKVVRRGFACFRSGRYIQGNIART